MEKESATGELIAVRLLLTEVLKTHPYAALLHGAIQRVREQLQTASLQELEQMQDANDRQSSERVHAAAQQTLDEIAASLPRRLQT